MLDSWKMALEDLIYAQPSPRRERDLLRAVRLLRALGSAQSAGELRAAYAGMLSTSPGFAQRERSDRSQIIGDRQVLEAAFALRYLELTTGRPLDMRRDSLPVARLAWMLAVAT